MNLNDYYLHALRDNQFYPSKNALDKLESILEKKNILSRRLLNYNPNYISFNGLDYISLCDPSKPRNGYSAYNYFIKNSLSLAISRNIDVIQPKMTYKTIKTPKDMEQYYGDRYTNFPDEVQVKDNIPISNIVAITIPLLNIISKFKTKERNKKTIIKELNKIKELLIKYNHVIPIYDIDTLINIDNEENIIKILNKKKTS